MRQEITTKAISLASKPFVMEIKVQNIEELISQSLKKKPVMLCRHNKNGHFNTIGEDYLIISKDKNAQVVCLNSGVVLSEINLKKRDMSTSIVFKDLLLVGTYVDTIFVFSAKDSF